MQALKAGMRRFWSSFRFLTTIGSPRAARDLEKT
jgi:hypothetical protein